MAPHHQLHVWLYGTHLGVLTSPSYQRLRFEPDPAVTDRWPLGSTVLSVSLPFTGRRPNGVNVRTFFEGLLPEGEARTALEREFRVARGDSFALLTELGRDCAGAVVLTPDSGAPDQAAGSLEPMTTADLEAALERLPERPLGASAEVRVSLAGQQDKLLLRRSESGRFFRTLDGAATNVLLKPEPTLFPRYVSNEAYCMRLAHELELTSVVVDVIDVGGRPVLVVPRYDREHAANDPALQRVHQEDLCQALAVDCSVQDRKYERDGGPSLAAVASTIDRHAMPADRRRLLAYTTFNIAVGNADAHGKNLSLLHHRNGQAQLAPLYDVSSTIMYDVVDTPVGRRRLSTELGMNVNGVRSIQQVSRADLVDEGRSWGLSPTVADEVVEGTLAALLAHVHATARGLDGVDPELPLTVEDRCLALLDGRTAASYTPNGVAGVRARAVARSDLRGRRRRR